MHIRATGAPPAAEDDRPTNERPDEDGHQGAGPPTDAEAPCAPAADRSGDDRRDPDEVGGPKGPEPTRFGDWERKGRCIDF